MAKIHSINERKLEKQRFIPLPMEVFMKRLWKILPSALAVVCFYSFTLVAPIYFEDSYFNMLQAKGRICSTVLLVFLAGAAVVCLWKRIGKEQRASKIRFCGMDGVILAFGALALLSCALSEQPWDALWGMKGWCVGGMMMAGLSLSCCLLCRWLPCHQNLWLPVLGVNVVIFLLTILHGMGIDALYLHREILPKQWFDYLSTIGNLNWYVGYLCLLVPMLAVGYLSSKQTGSQVIYLILLCLGIWNVVICGSDGIYLGFGFCMFFALPYLTATAKRMVRCMTLAAIYGLSLLVCGIAPCFAGMRENTGGIAGNMLRPEAAMTVLIASILGALFAARYWKRLSAARVRQITIALELLLLVVAVYFLYHALTDFGDAWGTNRGKTWRTTWEIYQSLPLCQKLLGVGPEQLYSYYEELSVWFSRPIVNAHSEPLQLLVTNGVLGVLCWGAVWCAILARYFRQQLWQQDSIAFFLPLAAYFAQAMVNSPQPLNAALLCMFTSWFRMKTEQTIIPEGD